MATLTIFTPAYNRAHTLGRTYASLLRQSCKEFIWLVVDDGSADHTGTLVRQWQEQDNGFEIQYIFKENGGMHTAHNVAYENIRTELNVCIDSDDILAENAVEKIKSAWNRVRDRGYAGLVGLDADMDGNIIGTAFRPGITETTLSGFYASGGSGDKKLVYRTDVIRRYPPYPVFQGEKYVALAYKYLLIDQDYKLAVLNDVLCNVEYQIDGSSNTMWRQYLRNPQGFAFWRTIQARYPASFAELIKNTIHYSSSKCLARKAGKEVETYPRKLLAALCAIPGMILAKIIILKNR